MTSSAAERALRAYCDPSVVGEYDLLAFGEKKIMLDALISTQRDFLLQLVQERVMSSSSGGGSLRPPPRPTGSDRPKRNDPLVQALADTGVQVDVFKQGDFDRCKESISRWGVKTGSWEEIRRYQRVVYAQKAAANYNETDVKGHFLHTSKAVVKTSESSAVWSSLVRIDIRQLTLFKVNRGTYIEGRIVGEVIKPMVGGTTLIQDGRGDVVLVAFYNLLQAEIHGKAAEPLLQKKVS